MGVGTQDHLPAACQTLPGVLVDDGLIGGDIDAAVLFRRREAEGVVVLVDSSAHGAQGVVAVGHGVGDGERLQAGCLGGLDDAHEGNVMGYQRVEFQAQLPEVLPPVVGAENGVGDGLFPCLVRSGLPLGLTGGDDLSVQQVRALSNDLYHRMIPPFDGGGAPARTPD